MKRLAQVVTFLACIASFRGLVPAAELSCDAGWCLQNPQTPAVLQPALNSVWGSSGSDVFAVGSDGNIRHYDGSSWSVMVAGGVYYLAGVHGFSGSNVFAVGAESGSKGVILHYDGTSWSRMDEGGGMLSLGSVWGSSSSDVFAGGYDYNIGTILHYDGSSWSRMDSGSHGFIYGFWGTSGSDVFAVGSGGTILHYDGTSWSPMSSGSTATLKGVWGTSGSNVYAAGTEHGVFQGMILHYDGTAWSPVVADSRYDFWGLWGSSGSDVFAVGLDYEKHAGVVLHYDGTSWSPTNINSGYEPKAVWGASGSDVFAVGFDGIRHFDGSTWTLMGSLSGDLFINVRGTSGDDVFATGERGECLHFDGSSWARTGSGRAACMTPWGASTDYGTVEPLMDFWGTSGTEVYAVGENGTILRYDGATWSPLAPGSLGLYLYGVWSASNEDIFAVGYDYPIHTGKIMHYDGTAWSIMVESPGESWDGVWGSSGSDVFAVGSIGNILHYNGSAWSPMNSGTGNMLNDVWGSSPTDVYAVGNEGTIRHYDGTSWTRVKSGTDGALLSVWGSSSRDVYAVGYGGLILHYSGPGPSWLNAGDGTEEGDVPLSWEDVDGETGYRIYRRVKGSTAETLIGETGADIIHFNDHVGCGGEVFKYKVAAVYSGGALSAASPIDSGFSSVCQPPAGVIVIESGDSFTKTRAVTLNLSATDTGGSGLDAMRFKNNGGTVSDWEPYQATKSWTLAGGAGSKTVSVQYKDKAGNISDADLVKSGNQWYADEIVYDPTAPTGSMLINNGAPLTNTTEVTLNLLGADTGGSGIESMKLVNSDGSASAWEPYQTTRAWSLTGGAGMKTVRVQFRDKAGNVSDADLVKSGAQAYKVAIEYTGP